MAKNIILCSDGTRNKGGVGHPTNVWTLFNSIDLQSYKHSDAVEQVAFYDDGVGTERLKFLKLIGGAFGWGLTRNVKELYAHLVKNYEAGDHIYLFGFSRGAFTVRTLAGLIDRCGVIDKRPLLEQGETELQRLVDAAYESYRKKGYTEKFFDHLRAMWRRLQARIMRRPRPQVPIDTDLFKDQYGVAYDPELYRGIYKNVDFEAAEFKGRKTVPIRFVGVWDTVDAVGLPFKEMADWWNNHVYHFKFPNTELGAAVNKACHVLSIDDERKTFHPTLFDEFGEIDKLAPGNGLRIEQVWFPGVHSNVGGGYPKQGLAGVTLGWMVGKAREHGLGFELCALKEIQSSRNVHDRLYDSRAGFGFIYRYAPRDLAAIGAGKLNKIRIHVGAFQRIARHTAGYAPFNLPPEGIEIVPEIPLLQTMPFRGQDQETLKRQVACLAENLSDPELKKISDLVTDRKVKQRYTCYLFVIGSLLFMLGLGIGHNLWSLITGNPILLPDIAWLRSLGTLLEGLFGIIPLVGRLFNGVLQPLLALPLITLTCLATLFFAYWKDAQINKQINNLMCGYWGKALKGPWWRSEAKTLTGERVQGEGQSRLSALSQIAVATSSAIQLRGKWPTRLLLRTVLTTVFGSLRTSTKGSELEQVLSEKDGETGRD